jgi:hypothetical protein
MCHFASFILTKNEAYYLDTSDSHEDIIEFFHLRDDYTNLVRVEINPPENKTDIQNPDKWIFKVDQDCYPNWTYKGDPTLEEQTRKALAKKNYKTKYRKDCFKRFL